MRSRRDDDSVLEDTEGWRDRSLRDKDDALKSLLRLTDALVDQSPFRVRIREWQDPRAPEDAARWYALVRRSNPR